MLRRLLVVAALVVLVVAAGGMAVARTVPSLSASGPTSVTGTEGSAVFEIADRTIRQVRYDDGGTLRYTFRLTNDGRLPVTVLGLAPDQAESRLFTMLELTSPGGGPGVRIGAGETRHLTLAMRMSGCETLSARAGSFVTEVTVRTRRAGMFGDEVTVALPEELHTGSAREAFCPRSTATSRPPG